MVPKPLQERMPADRRELTKCIEARLRSRPDAMSLRAAR